MSHDVSGKTVPSAKPSVAVQALLYGPAPFFAYPWKPALNALYGGDYPQSYKHFRMQHMDGSNLIYHCLCLAWQLSSNYALLRELDKLCAPLAERLSLPDKEKGAYLITRTTSFFWCLHLLRTKPTPLAVKIASITSIVVAHNYLGAWFDKCRHRIIFLQGILEAGGVQSLLLNRPTAFGKPALIYFALRTALWKYLSHLSEKDFMLKDQSKNIATTLALFCSAVSASKEPLRIVIMGLFGWMIYLMTGNKAIYFWSAGMMATISQGLAHRVAGEAGTLEVLQNDTIDQTSYEFSHVTFFPNLLFQACRAHMRAKLQ